MGASSLRLLLMRYREALQMFWEYKMGDANVSPRKVREAFHRWLWNEAAPSGGATGTEGRGGQGGDGV